MTRPRSTPSLTPSRWPHPRPMTAQKRNTTAVLSLPIRQILGLAQPDVAAKGPEPEILRFAES